MSEIGTVIASAVVQQDGATQDIARNVEHAARRTELVSSSIGQVREAASRAGSVADKVRSSAETLGAQAATLQSSVNEFLRGMRTSTHLPHAGVSAM